mgnify:CR=1 FL=1
MQIFPQYRFSLRGLLLFVTAISVVLGTYSLFEVIGASLALAVIGGAIYQAGTRHNRLSVSIAGFILSLTMAGLTIAWVFNWLVLGVGHIYWQGNWPTELRKMAKVSSAPHRIIARRDSSYRDYKEIFHWRVPLSAEQYAAIIQDRGWEVMPRNEVPPDFWQGFPAFWRPKDHATHEYHRGVNRMHYSAQEGFFTMYDRERQELYVYYCGY